MPKTAAATRSIDKSLAPQRPAMKERPHRGLTETEEEIADLASQMILYGGERKDVELLLTALARHQYRHYSFVLGSDRAELDRPRTKEHIAITVAGWYQHLGRHSLTKREDVTAIRSGPNTVKEMVRADIRRAARHQFEEFLTDQEGIEPVWLLNEILELVNAGDDVGNAVYLAMDRSDMYVRVPAEHKKRVKEFIALLEAAEQED